MQSFLNPPSGVIRKQGECVRGDGKSCDPERN